MTEHAPVVVDETCSAELREKLADRLRRDGHLRSATWRAVVETVPRHEFTRAFFRRAETPRGTQWTPVIPGPGEAGTWLCEVYTDHTLVTQLDGHVHPGDVDGPVHGDPTSSSTLPSLLVRMLQDLDPRDGDRVLLVGVGTGYSTALLCERLSSEQVTGVETDEAAADRARAAIKAAGYDPAVITGDGLLGHPGNAPYDKLIAFCSVRSIPTAWMEQVRPGGTIVTTVSGWLYGSGLVRLTVGDGGRAEGRFLPGTVSFMIARPQAAPPLAGVSDLLTQAAEERPAYIGPEVLSDWTPQFVAQLAVPGAQYLGMATDGGPMLDHLIDMPSRSFATLVPDGEDGYFVRQGGPLRLWDAVEEAIDTWRKAGEPPQDEFGLTVTPGHQRVWLGSPDGPDWDLPA
ncbi:ATP-grasp peptide maturase system methyltransferase [Streptomyces roseoverticillatus]|uniref:ATP-grasp peptide maturase system methyltransferase n=1 Tax=Streptomyces roseoverticillatus TaxID=66429 RepID=UPI001F3DA2C3|nr:ATP-grasp peptide maturase system methyltransferase [Streptomyces roseoverticillatus]MCF3106206.1 ATP-grasp peptide maturase system methyltransferase [Streptomyces roseoverticillatus]